MWIARLTRVGALESSTKLSPLVDTHLSRICSINSSTRKFSTFSSPILFNYTNASPGISSSPNISPQLSTVRNYSSVRHFDPYER